MGLFGGGSSSTSSVTSNIDFSPNIQFGENQESSLEKTTDQTSDVSPRFDDSTGLSASVGVGGNGGTAATSRQQQEQQPMQTARANQPQFKTVGSSMGLIGLGALFLGGAYLLKKDKKK